MAGNEKTKTAKKEKAVKKASDKVKANKSTKKPVKKTPKVTVKPDSTPEPEIVSEPVPATPEPTEPVILTEEEIREKEVMEKIAEAQRKKDELDREMYQIRYEKNRKLLQNIPCDNCGTLLVIDPDEFLNEGVTARPVTCKECEAYNTLTITFTDDPGKCDPTIINSNKGPEYDVLPITMLDEEQMRKRLQSEVIKLMGTRAKLDPRLILVLRLVNKMLGGSEE